MVKDGPGFLINRILTFYLNEAMRLLLEGVRIEALDSAMKAFGMPMGPIFRGEFTPTLETLDLVGDIRCRMLP